MRMSAAAQMQVRCRQKPSVELQRENERLHADCKRLVALAERSPDFQKWARQAAALRGVHYLPAAECLAAEAVVSQVYQPDRSREVRPSHSYSRSLSCYGCVLHEHVAACNLRLRPLLQTSPMSATIGRSEHVWCRSISRWRRSTGCQSAPSR